MLTCLTTEHDLRIVFIAVLICAATAATGLSTYAYALDSKSRHQRLWMLFSGFSAATGIWGTHFIAMLAYQPSITSAYDLSLTALSFALAAVATTFGFAVSARKTEAATIAGGTLIGTGIAVMHFTGMAALDVAGHIVWDQILASASLLLGVGFSVAALGVFHGSRGYRERLAIASLLLVLAIAGTHFTTMSAAQIVTDPARVLGIASLDRITLALVVFCIVALTLVGGIIAVFIGKIKDTLAQRSAHLEIEIEDRRRAVERIKLQQAILGATMRDDVFRHAPLEVAIAALNGHVTGYDAIECAYVYSRSDDDFSLRLLQISDRLPGRQMTADTVGSDFFVANGKLDQMSEPVVIPDVEADPRLVDARAQLAPGDEFCAAMFNPISIDGRVVGVFCVRARSSVRQWTQDEILFATSLANLASLVFERQERQKTEDALREANAAALAGTKAKSQFLANMSHEIRTPMNGVFGMTDLLARTTLDDRQRRLVDHIGQSARTLLTIINDILDLSRIEEGKLSLDSHDYQLAGCVEDAVALLAEDAVKKGLDINLYVDAQADGMVKGDSVRLRQVMLNVIGNAIKFTSAGEISVRVTPVGSDEPTRLFRFEVRDTGIGIDPQSLAQLFKPFTQADSSISRKYGGTGLGLSISRHLVGLMGGQMEMTSEPGRGTCVAFELPMDVTLSADTRVKANTGSLFGQRILAVDDRATNREIVCSYLAACGVQAETAENGAQALVMLNRAAQSGRPFAQAIVDHIMPGMDGLELSRRIKAEPALAATQLILLSSLSWSQDMNVTRDAGIERLLHKPIRRAELISVVTELLNRKPADVRAVNATVDAQNLSVKLNLNVLVAEDNPVNQVIAVEYLANCGCSATVVENGLQAVAAFEREAFDCILMDCQMPEMDGLQATRVIRERERETMADAIAIFAVTANAYEDDRERCIASGMNGYIRKPFSEADLAAALTTISGPHRKAAVRSVAKAAPIAPGQLAEQSPRVARSSGFASALKTTRPALYQRLVTVFLDHAPIVHSSLASAIWRLDFNGVMSAAHSLKSSSANIGAVRLSELCLDLETAARGKVAGNMAEIAGDLEVCLTSVCETLRSERATLALNVA